MHNETNAYNLGKKSFNETCFPDLETKLLAWFRRTESKHAVLSDDVVMAKAHEYARELKLSDFKGAANWLHRFKKRHGITQMVLHGEGT